MLEELARRVEAAAAVWRAVPLRQRLEILREAGSILQQKREALLDCLRADGLSTALAEFYGGWILRQGQAPLLEHTARELLRTTPSTGEFLARRPDGVVALITPGNSPTINTAPLFSILLAGNGVIMRAPGRDGGVRLIASECIGAALRTAGYSPDLVEVVTSRTRPLLDEIYASDIVDTIVFFGNAVAGRDVAARGHDSDKKVILELEGSDCMIVWSDADLDGALASAVHGFDFSTQPCPIPKHFLVHPAIEAAFTAGLRERAAALRSVEADAERGPLVPLFRPPRYELLVDEARTRGELVLGGERINPAGEADPEGPYGAPALARVPYDPSLGHSPLFCQEINVPVLPIVSFTEAFTELDDDGARDDAILDAMLGLVDQTPFGLRASIWTADDSVATRFVRGLGDVGLLIVNGDHAQHPAFLSPWGGPKRSGGAHGENHQFWQKTSHLQGIVGARAVVEDALLGAPDKFRVELRDRVAYLSFNRPARHNAVDLDLAAQLSDALEQVMAAARAEAIDAVVLRGEGKSFCSGADLGMLRDLDARRARRFMQDVTWSIRLLEQLPLPTLALVHGHCVGGGFEMAMHCDAIIAARTTSFALPEVAHGLTPTAGVVGRLVRAVGRHRAARWVLSGQAIDAEQALAAGLLEALVDDDALEAAGAAHIARIRERPPSGYRAVKRMLVGLGQPDTWHDELAAFETIMRERDND